ncbi:hypothetical protein K435DRAFT_796639 [Dendrothele bispora CBS 962.96]|uniref:Uncharacterized protein n=1 Tax=Dendrothele bispora (strain CBS 962.96) TaxID=1314807 RepID=A0A4S8M4T9_DENBC|nr:hypothetical protein K435DRAFT_796639 [Dendrothele bispora CBS 962.96]
MSNSEFFRGANNFSMNGSNINNIAGDHHVTVSNDNRSIADSYNTYNTTNTNSNNTTHHKTRTLAITPITPTQTPAIPPITLTQIPAILITPTQIPAILITPTQALVIPIPPTQTPTTLFVTRIRIGIIEPATRCRTIIMHNGLTIHRTIHPFGEISRRSVQVCPFHRLSTDRGHTSKEEESMSITAIPEELEVNTTQIPIPHITRRRRSMKACLSRRLLIFRMGMHILELPFHIQEASDVTPIYLSLPLPPGPAKEVQSIPEIVTQIITREAPKDAILHTHDPVKMFPLPIPMLPHFHTPSVSRIINLPKRHKPPHHHDHQPRSHRPTITLLEINTTHKMPPSRDLDPDTLVDLKVVLEVVLCPPRTHIINKGRIGKTF